MATTSDISRGMILKLDNNLYSVVEFGENKTARAAAKVWAKLKGVDNKRSIEKTWNSGENIFPVRVEKKTFQYLYKDEAGYNLMNNETFEQIALSEEMIDAPQFLMDGSEVFVFINTETELPSARASCTHCLSSSSVISPSATNASYLVGFFAGAATPFTR